MNGRLFSSRKYEVPLTHIILANTNKTNKCKHYEWNNNTSTDNDSDSTDSDCILTDKPTAEAHHSEEEDVQEEEVQEAVAEHVEQGAASSTMRPRRTVHPPRWHTDYDFD